MMKGLLALFALTISFKASAQEQNFDRVKEKILNKLIPEAVNDKENGSIFHAEMSSGTIRHKITDIKAVPGEMAMYVELTSGNSGERKECVVFSGSETKVQRYAGACDLSRHEVILKTSDDPNFSRKVDVAIKTAVRVKLAFSRPLDLSYNSSYSVRTGKRTDLKVIFVRDTSFPLLGEAYRDPHGLIWGEKVKDENRNPRYMKLEEAMAYCEKIGARLPTQDEFKRAAKYFGAYFGPWPLYYEANYDKDLAGLNMEFSKNGGSETTWTSSSFVWTSSSTATVVNNDKYSAIGTPYVVSFLTGQNEQVTDSQRHLVRCVLQK